MDILPLLLHFLTGAFLMLGICSGLWARQLKRQIREHEKAIAYHERQIAMLDEFKLSLAEIRRLDMERKVLRARLEFACEREMSVMPN